MRALSIRQPYAELILRGVKTREFRTRPTRLIGEPFYIYAARGPASSRRFAGRDAETEGRRIWSDDLAVPGRATRDPLPPPWMLELAEQLILGRLPTGLLVGRAKIAACERDAAAGYFAWHLTDVERLATPLTPQRHPQPAWFQPF